MKILYVEDEIAHVELTQRTLEDSFQGAFELYQAETIQGALRLLEAESDIDIVLSDLRLPDGSGLDLLKKIRARPAPPAVILVTGQGDQEVAVAALKAGAADYLVKQSDYLHRLPIVINNAVAQNRLLRQEDALREAEIKYRSLVEQISAVVFLDAADETETTFYMSPRIQELTGYTPDEWRADPDIWFKTIHPDDLGRIRQAYEKSHENEASFREEYRMIRRDGRVVWIKEDTNLIRDKNGHPLYWQGILLNITKEKETETAIRESEQRFRRIFHASPIATCVVTLEGGHFVDANEAFLNLTGKSFEELVGRTSIELGFWEKTQDRETFTQKLRERGGLQGIEIQYKDVPEGPKDTLAYYEMIELGGRPCVLSMFYEVTEQKKAQRALQRQLRELSVLHSVALAASTAQTVDELIEQTTNAIGNTLYPDNCGILLVDEATSTLRPHPSYRGTSSENLAKPFPKSQGITGKVAQTGKPIRVGDVTTEPSYIEATEGIRSELCVPITSRGVVIGVVNTESMQKNAYTERDERLLMTIANTLATATDKLRVFEEEKKRRLELEIINRVSTSLRGAQSLEEMLSILLIETLNLMNTPHGSIWLYDHSSDLLVQRMANGAEAQLKNKSVHPSQGMVGQTFTTGKKIQLSDFKQGTSLLGEEGESILHGLGGICIPIQSTAGPVGVLIVAVGAGRQIADESNLLPILAEITGNAIHRSQLYEHSQEQVRRLTTLRDIDSAIASSFDLRLTLNILIDQSMNHLKVDAVDIGLYHPDLQSLTYLISAGFHILSPTRPQMRIGDGLAGQVIVRQKTFHVTDLQNAPEARNEAFLKREGFVTYIGIPLIVKGQTKGVFEVFNRSPLSPSPDWMEFLHTLAGQAAIAIDNSQLFENLQRTNQELVQAYDTTLEGWARALELRDRETEGHTRRVTDLTLKLAKYMGIGDAEMVNILRGVLLHDIGKMGVPDNILKKTGKLSEEEWNEMRQHPVYAYNLLSPISYLRSALDIPYCHHEHWDGSGYPRGLKGEQIPLSARMFSVIDIWDALLSDRPYRKAWQREKVIRYLKDISGTQLDPNIVTIFLRMIAEEEPETG